MCDFKWQGFFFVLTLQEGSTEGRRLLSHPRTLQHLRSLYWMNTNKKNGHSKNNIKKDLLQCFYVKKTFFIKKENKTYALWVSSQRENLSFLSFYTSNALFDIQRQFTWLSWEKEQHRKKNRRYIYVVTLKICSISWNHIFWGTWILAYRCFFFFSCLNSPVEEEVTISRQKYSEYYLNNVSKP